MPDYGSGGGRALEGYGEQNEQADTVSSGKRGDSELDDILAGVQNDDYSLVKEESTCFDTAALVDSSIKDSDVSEKLHRRHIKTLYNLCPQEQPSSTLDLLISLPFFPFSPLPSQACYNYCWTQNDLHLFSSGGDAGCSCFEKKCSEPLGPASGLSFYQALPKMMTDASGAEPRWDMPDYGSGGRRALSDGIDKSTTSNSGVERNSSPSEQHEKEDVPNKLADGEAKGDGAGNDSTPEKRDAGEVDAIWAFEEKDDYEVVQEKSTCLDPAPLVDTTITSANVSEPLLTCWLKEIGVGVYCASDWFCYR